MTLDTTLGFGGLFVALFSIAAFYLWPEKKWIGRSALIAAIVVGILWAKRVIFAPPANADTSVKIFSGIVLDQANHKPIQDADILVVQDQATPEVLHSDSHGVFVVQIHPQVTTLRVSVNSNGYVPEVRTTSPSRTGPEEFILRRTSSSVNPRPHNKSSTPASPPPTVSQKAECLNTQAPCVGINNGTANFYTLGDPPPPIRNVKPETVTDAIATLQVAAKGTKIRIDVSGQSSDLDSFVNQVIQLFKLGEWDPFIGVRVIDNRYTLSTSQDTSTSHMEGVRCFSQDANIAFIAKRALEQISYPCQVTYTPEYIDRFPADFYISIGPPR